MPVIEGVGAIRQRYPIMPVHEQGSATWKEVKAVTELIMGKDMPEVKAILADKREGAYGVELELEEGGGHSHHVCQVPASVSTPHPTSRQQVTLSALEVHKLKSGQSVWVKKLSTEDSAHSHLVEVCSGTPADTTSKCADTHTRTHTAQVRYDASRQAGKNYLLSWCTTLTTSKQESCPWSAGQTATKCGFTAVEGHPCCWGKCPDGHPSLAEIL